MSGVRERPYFTRLEAAQLRRLVFRAFDARGSADFTAALTAVEDWQWQTAPDRLERHAAEGGEAS